MRWMLLLVMTTMVLAGCFGTGSKRLSQEEAEAVAQEAMEDFQRDFASVDGGALTTVHGQFSLEGDESLSGAVDFHIEWGLDDTARISLDIEGSGYGGLEITLHCLADTVVLDTGKEPLEIRRPDGRPCLDSIPQNDDPFAIDTLEPAALEVEPQDNGGVIATHDGEQGDSVIHIDARGRVTQIELQTGAGNGTLDVGYGARRALDAPDAELRVPALLSGFGQHDGEVYSWQAAGGEEDYAFEEIEVRVIDPESNETIATFQAGEDGDEAGFTFSYDDDGDGRFSGGDTFTIQHDGWTQDGQYDVVVWDTWADRAVGDVPVPGLGWLLALGLLGAVLLARR